MQNLSEIGANFSSFLASLSPQVKDGSLQWYLSGSLATIAMANAEIIAEITLDNKNNIVGEKPSKYITDDQRKKMQKFSRKLGYDVDVVNVNGGLFSGAPIGNKPHILNIKEHVPNILDLMSWSATVGGSMYIDNLDSEREIAYHPVAKIKLPNGEVYITAPPEQLAHKLHEAITLREMLNGKFSENAKVIAKYEKDIRDLSSMFYGFHELYGKEEFLNRVYSALTQKDGSKFNIENPHLEDVIKMIIKDSANYLKTIADDKSDKEIESFLSDLLDKRIAENDSTQKQGDQKTPLQLREECLSHLEQEEETISIEESINEHPQEGQNIGE